MTPAAQLAQQGFTIINNVFDRSQINAMADLIAKTDRDKPVFRVSNDLFAIRQFLKELPGICPLIFTNELKVMINELFGEGYFVTKSIYFDKPGGSNWFVAYHQDLTISVDRKADIPNYGPWTVKQGQFAVQPSLDILKRNFTIRIHLDDTDQDNGALRVIAGSHLKNIYRPENIDWDVEEEYTCNVQAGGIMIMSPLLLHASDRTLNNKARRVIHIEFSNAQLPADIKWSEKISLN